MKKHILVIDDDTLLGRIINRILMANGYMITTANRGRSLLFFKAAPL